MNKYPYYLHTNKQFVEYWKRVFDKPLNPDVKIEVYIDYPLCRSLCKFCAFGNNRLADYKDKIKYYEEAVIQLILDMNGIIPKIDNIYFGGGTPSLWSRDALSNIANNMKHFKDASFKTMEIHPIDLTNNFLDFVLNDIDITLVSIGIQSFDSKSNKDQTRIPANIDKLKNAISYIHDNGKFINIDLVALFNYYDEIGWDIYRNDAKIAMDLGVDDICTYLNFKLDNYIERSIEYRKILKNIIDNNDTYYLRNPKMLSLNINDVKQTADAGYHLVTEKYKKFYKNSKIASMNLDDDHLNRNITIGFGGAWPGHGAISRISMIREDIHSGFDFDNMRLIHKVSQSPKEINSIIVGKYKIDTNIN